MEGESRGSAVVGPEATMKPLVELATRLCGAPPWLLVESVVLERDDGGAPVPLDADSLEGADLPDCGLTLADRGAALGPGAHAREVVGRETAGRRFGRGAGKRCPTS